MAKWHDLHFTMSSQEQSNWCWAAIASSVSSFFNDPAPFSQCQIATAMLTNSSLTLDCCAADRLKCNVYWFLASPLHFVNHLKDWDVGNVVEFVDLAGEIDKHLPLAVRIEYRSGGAHFLIISGYFDVKIPVLDDYLCIVSDPIYGDSLSPYNDLRCEYHDGYWTDTYRTAA